MRGRESELDLGDLEHRVGRGDEVVAVQRGAQRVAEAVAVHRGDHGLPARALGERGVLGGALAGRSLVHRPLQTVVHVATARERLALPEQDGDVGVVVTVETVQRVDEAGDVLVAQRVVLLGAVERDVRDAVADFVEHGHARIIA